MARSARKNQKPKKKGKETPRLGLWLIGAAGNVAATVSVGLAALRRRLTLPTGMVSADPAFAPLGLIDPADLVLGGHDIRSQSVLETATAMQTGSGVFGGGLLETVAGDLKAFQKEIRAGFPAKHSELRATAIQGGASVVDRLAADIRDFAARNRCSRVVVINVASTEPIVDSRPEHRSWNALLDALSRNSAILPASSIYALAAISARCPYVNFTPSTGVDFPAIVECAAKHRVPIMGRDGKTGETLLKSALAPMFRHRALRVLSWDGHNILGNNDGAVLSDPAVKAAKLRTKDSVAAKSLGYDVDTSVSIQHVPSLDDWKIAWDHVHFEGFLGVKMSLQFTWQGCDSILAAPLVIDLARLAEYHARTGQSGVMSHLACFFKRPMGTEEASLPAQVDMLARYVAKQTGKARPGGRRN